MSSYLSLYTDVCSHCHHTSPALTCSRRQVEDKYSQDAGEDTGHDDVDDVEQGLALDDQVKSDVFVQVLLHILAGGFVTDGPLPVFCGGRALSEKPMPNLS